MTAPIPEWVQPDTRIILERLEAARVATQEQINQYAAAVGGYISAVQGAVDGIRTDIDLLKRQNPELDTSALESRLAELGTTVGNLTNLDAENPPATPPPTP